MPGRPTVEVHCGVAAVDTRRDRDGRITAIVTGDGRTLPCDQVGEVHRFEEGLRVSAWLDQRGNLAVEACTVDDAM